MRELQHLFSEDCDDDTHCLKKWCFTTACLGQLVGLAAHENLGVSFGYGHCFANLISFQAYADHLQHHFGKVFVDDG